MGIKGSSWCWVVFDMCVRPLLEDKACCIGLSLMDGNERSQTVSPVLTQCLAVFRTLLVALKVGGSSEKAVEE